jgi:acetyl/propionyl-CoA carboxylase alpha subunit
MKYFVRVGERDQELEIDGDSVSLNGHTFRARLEDLPSEPMQLLSIDGTIHRLIARRVERGVYDVSIDGHRFTVEALDERARVIRELSGAGRKVVAPAHLMAPMPGLIIRVNVKEGDQVRPGQGLVVMEAMKMENELRATASAVVKRVAVTTGSAVEKGAMLLEMEPAS